MKIRPLSSLSNIAETDKCNTFSTASVHARERRDWLQTMICQEYTRVKVTPPVADDLFNEVTSVSYTHLDVYKRQCIYTKDIEQPKQ